MSTVLPIDDADSRYPTRGRRRVLGEAGPRVFPIAIGGNAFGWTASEESSYEVLDTFRELGGNLIDTSDSYASGRSDIIIGNWMRSRGVRRDMVVTTRVRESTEHPGHSAEAVTEAIEATLGRLRTDYIDMVFLHIDDESMPLEEALVALDENLRRGKIRGVGVTDNSANRVLGARIVAAQLGLTPFTALQCRYNLMHRSEYEGTLAAVAEQQSLSVMPKFALDGGFLAGNYRAKSELDLNSTGNIVLGGDAQSHLNRRGQRILATLDRVAREHDCAPATIALAWILTRTQVTAPIVGASNASQISDLVAAVDVALTRQQVASLDEVSA